MSFPCRTEEHRLRTCSVIDIMPSELTPNQDLCLLEQKAQFLGGQLVGIRLLARSRGQSVVSGTFCLW